MAPATLSARRLNRALLAALLIHARRTQLVPDQYRSALFNIHSPRWVGAVLVDGRAAGSWHHRDGLVEVTPFAPLPARVRREVHEDAARLAAFHQ